MRSCVFRGVVLLTILSVACGGGDAKSPTAPSAAAPALSSISTSPSGVGLEGVTQFTFSTNTSGTAAQNTYQWQFGDGSSTTGGATVSHVFARAGTYTVQVTAGQASATSTARVASLVGTWTATITGHTHYPSQRPVPITSIELQLDQSPTGADLAGLSGTWRDDAGCRAGTGYQSSLSAAVRDPRTLSIGASDLFCNDGDLYLNGAADDELRTITGTCPMGGPDCRFVMVRQ